MPIFERIQCYHFTIYFSLALARSLPMLCWPSVVVCFVCGFASCSVLLLLSVSGFVWFHWIVAADTSLVQLC